MYMKMVVNRGTAPGARQSANVAVSRDRDRASHRRWLVTSHSGAYIMDSAHFDLKIHFRQPLLCGSHVRWYFYYKVTWYVAAHP